MIFPHSDPWVSFVLVLWTLLWSIIGAVFWETVRETPKPPGWSAFLIAFGGLAVWALAAYHGLAHLRRRILSHWGMENHRCCGGHCARHTESVSQRETKNPLGDSP